MRSYNLNLGSRRMNESHRNRIIEVNRDQLVRLVEDAVSDVIDRKEFNILDDDDDYSHDIPFYDLIVRYYRRALDALTAIKQHYPKYDYCKRVIDRLKDFYYDKLKISNIKYNGSLWQIRRIEQFGTYIYRSLIMFLDAIKKDKSIMDNSDSGLKEFILDNFVKPATSLGRKLGMDPKRLEYDLGEISYMLGSPNIK